MIILWNFYQIYEINSTWIFNLYPEMGVILLFICFIFFVFNCISFPFYENLGLQSFFTVCVCFSSKTVLMPTCNLFWELHSWKLYSHNFYFFIPSPTLLVLSLLTSQINVPFKIIIVYTHIYLHTHTKHIEFIIYVFTIDHLDLITFQSLSL